MEDDGEAKWIVWARELQALAQSGLTFTTDVYDRQRYERLRLLSAEIYCDHSDEPIQRHRRTVRIPNRICHAEGRCQGGSV